MDIDKDFINGLGIPPDMPGATGQKMNNIDVEIQETTTVVPKKSVVETAEDAISAMISNPIINNDLPQSVDEKSPFGGDEAKQEKNFDDSRQSLGVNEDMVTILDEVRKMSVVVSNVAEQVTSLKAGMTRFAGYDTAVETLKRSLSVHQHNEDNIYKELEGYKKNQYYNYIRPFFEFLINLLTDMIASKKQYENDKDEFIEHHGQEIYDEIIELHNYYTQQIESQLQIQGVEIIEYSPNTPFISVEQIISTPVLTEDNSLVGFVAIADSACYKFEDKIIKKAKVHVYKAKPAENK